MFSTCVNFATALQYIPERNWRICLEFKIAKAMRRSLSCSITVKDKQLLNTVIKLTCTK